MVSKHTEQNKTKTKWSKRSQYVNHHGTAS